jgi:hypothetical protein
MDRRTVEHTPQETATANANTATVAKPLVMSDQVVKLENAR